MLDVLTDTVVNILTDHAIYSECFPQFPSSEWGLVFTCMCRFC